MSEFHRHWIYASNQRCKIFELPILRGAHRVCRIDAQTEVNVAEISIVIVKTMSFESELYDATICVVSSPESCLSIEPKSRLTFRRLMAWSISGWREESRRWQIEWWHIFLATTFHIAAFLPFSPIINIDKLNSQTLGVGGKSYELNTNRKRWSAFRSKPTTFILWWFQRSEITKW